MCADAVRVSLVIGEPVDGNSGFANIRIADSSV